VTEIWFADSPDDVELSKARCLACPVRAACLSGALDRGEPWGVWGGELKLGGREVDAPQVNRSLSASFSRLMPFVGLVRLTIAGCAGGRTVGEVNRW
jgi:hypothetical protein